MKSVTKRSKRGPFFAKFDGLHVSLRSANRVGYIIKQMLVSHGFVELYRLIIDDGSFDKALFAAMTEAERDFMKYLLKQCKVESREFESAFNQTISHLVDRLNMISNAIKIGDDNPILRDEMKQLLDKLYAKNVFSSQFYMQFKLQANRING